jgi:hypothetical protein
MNLVSATVECPHCPREFHQIDTSRERAVTIARAALDRHLETHEEDAQTAAALGVSAPTGDDAR